MRLYSISMCYIFYNLFKIDVLLFLFICRKIKTINVSENLYINQVVHFT